MPGMDEALAEGLEGLVVVGTPILGEVVGIN